MNIPASVNVLARRCRSGLERAAAPFGFTIGFVLLMAIWQLFGLPDAEGLQVSIESFYRRYGLIVVGCGALIEGIVLVNLYFPGSAVIVLGVVSNRGRPIEAAVLVSVASLSFIIASQLNYLIGRLGLQYVIAKCGGKQWLNQAHYRYTRYGVTIIPASFIHPNLGAFVAVVCGVARLDWKAFACLSSVSIVLWNIFWGLVVYSFADAVAKATTHPLILLLILLGWSLAAFVVGVVRHSSQTDAGTRSEC